MEIVAIYVLFGALCFFVAKMIFPHTVSFKEIYLGIVIQLLVVGTLMATSYSNGFDTQILNGMVIGKERDLVSCSHSYSCNCRTSCSGSGSSRTCSTVCSTCYRHTHDYDWLVKTTVGTIEIDRIDSQGAKEPPRWTRVAIGEFAAKESSYFNYIKASPFSVFDKSVVGGDVEVPSYPEVFDYYRVNRVIDFGSKFKADKNRLNGLLNEGLKTLGEKKKVNVVVVFHSGDVSFENAVEAKMYGGKINDVMVLLNASEDGTINRVRVVSWSKNDLVKVTIRDEILDMKVVDVEKMAGVILSNVDKHFQHRNIEEFEYLLDDIRPPTWALILMAIFGIIFPFVWSYFSHKKQMFN